MKKGFTLIELLAVIVILAIIAIIAVPIVLNIIKDSKESAVFRSAEFYTDALQNAIALSLLHNKQINNGTYAIMENGNVCLGTYDKEKNTCDGEELEIQVKGEKPTSGTITIKDGQINKVILNISDKELVMNSNGELDYYLAPGLYDENDILIVSWDYLVDEYDIKDRIEMGSVYYAESGYSSLNEILSFYTNAHKLVIDESVRSIGSHAFGGCDSLTEVIIPNSVTSIGDWAFSGCKSLKSISIPGSVKSIEEAAFWDCSSLKSITIPGSVKSFGSDAFTSCTGLTEVIIENGVTSIGALAFSDCPNLTKVIIPNSVESIGGSAFAGCTGLVSITIPNSVTSIDGYAFEGCTGLTTIYYKGNTANAPWGAPNNPNIETNF